MKTVVQKDSYGCGPIAAYNILSLKNKKAILKKLYKECNACEDGTYEKDLRKCLKKYSLTISWKRSKVLKKNAVYLCIDGPYTDEIGKCFHYTVIKNRNVYNYFDEKKQVCYKKSKRFNKLRNPVFKEVYESKKIK